MLRSLVGSEMTHSVELCRNLTTGLTSVFKIFNRQQLQRRSSMTLTSGPSISDHVAREVALMQLMSHSNLVKHLNIYDESVTFLYLELEYINGGPAMTFDGDKYVFQRFGLSLIHI
eukprot:TRINITY_DN37133_c0_g1_i2.p1 TRINITY_DN37133_c0_g1~~TRINITY_DN37133_c0_g1_i2.p1  ORF type:complete len:116 (+),score=25.24 TRINITY_DN37133_c0_g1_i2:156-503(+)